MKPHHIMLLTAYLTFALGMVIGTALAHSPVLWIAAIVLVTIIIVLMGWISYATIKPRKKRLPVRRASRVASKLKVVR
jgi:hypothetical protein